MTTLDGARERATTLLPVLAGAAAVFLVTSRGGTMAVAAAAAVALGLLAVAADRAPQAAMGAVVAAIVLLPVYWGRPVVGLAIVAVPATAGALVLSLAALRSLPAVRWGLLDAAYLGFVGFLALAAYLNTTSGAGAAAGVVWRSVLPYVVWRALALHAPRWVTVARVLVASGTAMAVFALVERAVGANWYQTALPATYQTELAVSLDRYGALRAEASFGEPITFGMFLGLCLVLTVTLAIASGRRAERLLSLAAIGVLAAAILASGSRAALGVAAFGLLIQAGRFVTKAYAKRMLAVAGLATVALLTTGFARTAALTLSTVTGTESREARSAQYRFEVFEVLGDPGQYTVLGKRAEAAGVGSLAVENSGIKSLDNQYAFLLVTGGVLALGSFLVVGFVVFKEALTRQPRDLFERAVTSGLASVFAGLLVVALLTQLYDLFAILVALVAGARQARRALA